MTISCPLQLRNFELYRTLGFYIIQNLFHKKVSISIFIIIFIISTDMVMGLGNYSRSDLIKMYPDLGENFVMFPNGSDGVVVGYLTPPPSSRWFFGFGRTIEDDVKFILFTRDNINGRTLRNYHDLDENFDKSKMTVLLTHGWMPSGKDRFAESVKDAYLKASDINVFIVDWSYIAGSIFYFTPMRRTKEVGAYISRLLNYLTNDLGMDPKTLHLVGHGLGAHVSGYAARLLSKGKVGRITGLDPVILGFTLNSKERLNKDDSSFVDIIHTCSGFLGLQRSIGHVDFYPNGGGPPQPGCSILQIFEACSHVRSWELFTRTISSNLKFLSSKCYSYATPNKNRCNGPKVLMGEPTPHRARGDFYLETFGNEPFLKPS